MLGYATNKALNEFLLVKLVNLLKKYFLVWCMFNYFNSIDKFFSIKF